MKSLIKKLFFMTRAPHKLPMQQVIGGVHVIGDERPAHIAIMLYITITELVKTLGICVVFLEIICRLYTIIT